MVTRAMLCIENKGRLIAELAGSPELRWLAAEIAVLVARMLGRRG